MSTITFFDRVTSDSKNADKCTIITAADRMKADKKKGIKAGKHAGMDATDILKKVHGAWDDETKDKQEIADRDVLKGWHKGDPANHATLKTKHAELLESGPRRKMAFFQVGDGTKSNRGFFVALCAVCNVALQFKTSNAMERVKCDEHKSSATSNTAKKKFSEVEKIQRRIDTETEDRDSLTELGMQVDADKMQKSIDRLTIKLKEAKAKATESDSE